MKVNIFVEGVDDQELVAALLSKLGKVVAWEITGKARQGSTVAGAQVFIYQADGWTNLPAKNIKPFLQQDEAVGVRNLIVFDADHPSDPHGGFTGRKAELHRQATELGLFFDLFLLPVNSADGNLEDLLKDLIHPDHQQVVSCFSNYENCLRGCVSPDGLPYRIPASKAKIYAYVEAMPLTDEERREHKRRGATKYFGNSAYWNLDAAQVQPLRAFLDQHIQ